MTERSHGPRWACVCLFVRETQRQRFHKDTPLVITPTHKESHIHEGADINQAPLSVNFKHFKAKVKVWESGSGLPCLWKRSKNFCIPQPLHFPASPPDANWQTERMNEINNHTNKGEGGRETTRGQRKESARERGEQKERERESGSITHQRSFIISWGTRWREENKIAICPALSLFFSLQFIWSLFFFACLSIRTWLWESSPQDLWSWKSLRDLSPDPTF